MCWVLSCQEDPLYNMDPCLYSLAACCLQLPVLVNLFINNTIVIYTLELTVTYLYPANTM